jgi:hypothetical protein
MESKTWRWMKGDQSNWSNLSLDKEERKKQNASCEGKGINRDFILPVKTQKSVCLDLG